MQIKLAKDSDAFLQIKFGKKKTAIRMISWVTVVRLVNNEGRTIFKVSGLRLPLAGSSIL